MPDWTAGMQQTYEYYEVDPWSWKDKRRITTITSCSVTRDSDNETLGSASIDSTEEFGEMYIRVYLKTIQNGIEYRESLGTFIVQTPNDKFDGKVHSFSYDAYTPLLELKDGKPPIGYYLPKNSNIMERAESIIFDNCRVPVIGAFSDEVLHSDYVADDDDTWLGYIDDLIANAKYDIGLDEIGRIVFFPVQELATLQPIWTYNDDNSSILSPSVDVQRDLYGIPNVVEVLYTANDAAPVYVRVENNNANSPTSIPTRGREIIHRDTNPSLTGTPSTEELKKYAVSLLKKMSTLEYSLTYTHGYCPVRLGDCVLINYERAGIKNVKAKVIRQNIKCEPGCQVEETAVYTKNLWENE